MNQREIEAYILNLEGAKKSYPFEKNLAVFSVNEENFAIIEEKKKPLRVSLRCEKKLAALLIERYDEVMPGHKLNKNKWITAVLSGQLSSDEILDLVRHSYLLASA